MQRIPESSCARKETVDIDILVTSRNGDKKNHAIYQNNEYTYFENKEVEPVELNQMSIYQSNTYRKDFSWLRVDDEPRAQKRQQVMDQQSYIYIFAAYPTIPRCSLEHLMEDVAVGILQSRNFGKQSMLSLFLVKHISILGFFYFSKTQFDVTTDKTTFFILQTFYLYQYFFYKNPEENNF